MSAQRGQCRQECEQPSPSPTRVGHGHVTDTMRTGGSGSGRGHLTRDPPQADARPAGGNTVTSRRAWGSGKPSEAESLKTHRLVTHPEQGVLLGTGARVWLWLRRGSFQWGAPGHPSLYPVARAAPWGPADLRCPARAGGATLRLQGDRESLAVPKACTDWRAEPQDGASRASELTAFREVGCAVTRVM